VDPENSGVPDYFDRLRGMSALEEQALFNHRGKTIGGQSNPERVTAMQVTPSFFRVLRVNPFRGRNFTEAEGELGSEHKVILSYALWQQRFGGDNSAIGQDLRLNGEPYTIVGVMPQGFRFISPDVRLYVPLAFTPEEKSDEGRHNNSWQHIARLKSGATIQQAQSQVDAINQDNYNRFPQWQEIIKNVGFRTNVVSLQDFLVRRIRSTLYLLWGGVAFVLLIGCVNIANLALVRSTSRMKELATRHALGAGEGRMARQLLTETTVLTVCGGICGLLIGGMLLAGLARLELPELSRGAAITMDRSVVLFGLGLSLIVGLLVGAIPVVRVLRANLGSMIREEGRGGTASRGTRLLRRALVTGQVAIALVLLIGAGLLFTSFKHVVSVNPGFRSESILTGNIGAPAPRYSKPEELTQLYDRILQSIRNLPGVTSVGATSTIPFGGMYDDSVIVAEDRPMQPGESLVSPNALTVTSGYFETMGIPLVKGRYFTDADRADAPLAIIIDERLARHFWGDKDPLGRRLFRPEDKEHITTPGPNTRMFTIVGVVKDVKLRGMVGAESVGAYYFPYPQSPEHSMTFAIKTAADPVTLTSAIQRQVSQIDPELPFYDVRTMDQLVELSLVGRRLPMLLAVAFGVIALLLSAIGIYGVLAYGVAQRTREFGIRLALGSETVQIFKLVLGEGLVIVGIGLALGLAGVLLLGRALESQLYQVKASDPTVLGFVAVVLAIVAFVACLVPARRATRIDPVIALSQE
jgi:predicted permease